LCEVDSAEWAAEAERHGWEEYRAPRRPPPLVIPSPKRRSFFKTTRHTIHQYHYQYQSPHTEIHFLIGCLKCTLCERTLAHCCFFPLDVEMADVHVHSPRLAVPPPGRRGGVGGAGRRGGGTRCTTSTGPRPRAGGGSAPTREPGLHGASLLVPPVRSGLGPKDIPHTFISEHLPHRTQGAQCGTTLTELRQPFFATCRLASCFSQRITETTNR